MNIKKIFTKKFFIVSITLCIFVIMFTVIITLKNTSKEVIEIDGTVPQMNKSDLITDSDLIIRGKVKNILPSKLNSNNNVTMVQTDIVIDIVDIFKGEPYSKQSVKVRIDKGEVGKMIVKSNGFPDFINNEEVLLFLSRDNGDLSNESENYYVLTGMFQGKFNLTEKEGIFSNGIENIKLNELKKDIATTLENSKGKETKMQRLERAKKQNEELFGK